jgi:hypothetical protein
LDLDEDSDQDTNDEQEPAADDYAAPSKDEWERTQAALKRANDEAKRYRLRSRELTRAQTAAKAAADAAAAAAAGTTEQHERALAAAAQAEQKLKPVAVKAAAHVALLSAGLTDPNPQRLNRLYKLFDLDEIQIDEDGEVTGLEEQVGEIVADYPELFGTKEVDEPVVVPPPPKKRPPVIDASDRPPVLNPRQMTTGERIAASVLGE